MNKPGRKRNVKNHTPFLNSESIITEQNKDLSHLNTLGVAARAREYVAINEQTQLARLFDEHPGFRDNSYVLGGGSNILFTSDFEGLIVHLDITGLEVEDETDEHVWIRVGAGNIWHQLVLETVDRGWGGLENLSLIPGTTGAAPIQNIGAYGVELSEIFSHLHAFNRNSGAIETFHHDECEFGYRDSIFKRGLKKTHIITDVTLRLTKHPQVNLTYAALERWMKEHEISNPTIKQVSEAVIAIRRSKLPDPRKTGNAGSFFKNPIIDTERYQELCDIRGQDIPNYPVDDNRVKVPAGWLIDQAGWRGKREGNVGTYEKQALVIVNHGGATGNEILSFARKIQQSVVDEFGIELEPEVNIL